MGKVIPRRVSAYLLALSLFITGCSEKSQCSIPTRHVHRYEKVVDDDITISKYILSENLINWGYKWCEDYIEITKDDEEVYKVLDGSFEGKTNWEYLYYQMANHHDYLKYYYDYYTWVTKTRTNSKGKVETYRVRVHHYGWHTNSTFIHNTGKVKVCHHRYYGYKVVLENGIFKLERSSAVDDIRQIIEEYPYFREDCVTVVESESFMRRKSELPYLTPEDFDAFENPNLENKNLYYGNTK